MIILPSWKLPSGGTITKECDGVMNDWLFVVDFFTNFLGGDGKTLLSSSERLLTWFLPRRLRLVEFKIGGSVSMSCRDMLYMYMYVSMCMHYCIVLYSVMNKFMFMKEENVILSSLCKWEGIKGPCKARLGSQSQENDQRVIKSKKETKKWENTNKSQRLRLCQWLACC